MPLRIDNGIPITPRAAGPQPLTAGTTPQPKDLPQPKDALGPHELDIKPVAQRHDMWCWAACVEMVLAHLKRRQDQCAIVAEKLKREGHAGQPVCANEDDFGQEGCREEFVDDVWRAFQVKSPVMGPGDNPGPVSFETIKQEIDVHRRPVEVGLRWHEENNGGGHVILIKGWDNVNGKDVVILNDPLASGRLVVGNEGLLDFDELAGAFGHGEWTHTWTNLESE